MIRFSIELYKYVLQYDNSKSVDKIQNGRQFFLFTKQQYVLPPNLTKYGSHQLYAWNFCDHSGILQTTGPVFCLLLGVSSDYAQPITGQVTEVTCPVIGQAQPELTPSRRQKAGPDVPLKNLALTAHNPGLGDFPKSNVLSSSETDAAIRILKIR